jgi:hypothetical protein
MRLIVSSNTQAYILKYERCIILSSFSIFPWTNQEKELDNDHILHGHVSHIVHVTKGMFHDQDDYDYWHWLDAQWWCIILLISLNLKSCTNIYTAPCVGTPPQSGMRLSHSMYSIINRSSLNGLVTGDRRPSQYI